MAFSVLTMGKVPPWEPSQLRLMYIQVAEHLTARIEANDLHQGQRMPPERDLAIEYGVSYGTVRRAVAILRDNGLIVTIHGRGTYVTERD